MIKQLEEPLEIGEVKTVKTIELRSITHNPGRSITVEVALLADDDSVVDTRTFTFSDTEERINTFTEIRDVTSNTLEFDYEIVECVVSDLSTNQPLPITINGPQVILDVETLPNKVRVFGKYRIPPVTDYSDIVDGLTIQEDKLWEKILSKLQ